MKEMEKRFFTTEDAGGVQPWDGDLMIQDLTPELLELLVTS